MIDKIKNFFLEDLSEVVGVYYDGEKIFLARLTDEVEFAESDFEIQFDKNFSEAEQLAEKISVMCTQRGWKNSKIGMCLRETEVASTYEDFKNIPIEEISNAVKSWAISQSGLENFFSFLEVENLFWLESISKSSAEKYISAWKKVSCKLLALTALPEKLNLSASEKAEFVAKIAANKKSPNLLQIENDLWDWRKIIFSVSAVVILFFVGLTFEIFYDLNKAEKNFELAQKKLSEYEEVAEIYDSVKENTAESKDLNFIISEQKISEEKFNILLSLGKISDGKIELKKISVSENFMEIEGLADEPGEIRKYLVHLKFSISRQVMLKNFSETPDGRINFSVQIEF